jgi:hypothetical protein
MLKFLKRLTEKWNGWVGDRDMENAMRGALTRKGLRGKAAQFSRVRLVAVQRPGWLQVYTFDAAWEEKDEVTGHAIRVFGLVRQDERYNKTEVQFFDTTSARSVLLNQWADGLSRLR